MAIGERVSEDELTKSVLSLLALYGWRAIHQKPARLPNGRIVTAISGPSAKGWPDIFAVRETRALAVELKVGGRKPRPEQMEWLTALNAIDGIEAYFWDDRDWDSGAINAIVR